MPPDIHAAAHSFRSCLAVPAAAKAERRRDLRDGLEAHPGIDRAVGAPLDWLVSIRIAHCWLMLYQVDGEQRYLDGATVTNSFVRRALRIEGDPDVREAVKGSLPVSGEYGRYQFLNWAVKFFIDASFFECDTAVVTPGGMA